MIFQRSHRLTAAAETQQLALLGEVGEDDVVDDRITLRAALAIEGEGTAFALVLSASTRIEYPGETDP